MSAVNVDLIECLEGKMPVPVVEVTTTTTTTILMLILSVWNENKELCER